MILRLALILNFTCIADIMYALSDPVKYQSDLDKHSKMIQQMGVDDTDDDDKGNRTVSSDEMNATVSTMKKGSKSGIKENEAGVSISSTREIGKLVSRSSSAIVAVTNLDKTDGKHYFLNI